MRYCCIVFSKQVSSEKNKIKCYEKIFCVCVCVCVCVCGHVYVVYEDTNLYNDMGMT